MKAELVADLFDVVLGRARADEELLRNLPISQAVRDESGDFLLAPGQRPGGTRANARRTGLVRKRLRGGSPRAIVSLKGSHV